MFQLEVTCVNIKCRQSKSFHSDHVVTQTWSKLVWSKKMLHGLNFLKNLFYKGQMFCFCVPLSTLGSCRTGELERL